MSIKIENLKKAGYRRSYLKYSLREAVSDQVRIIRESNNLTQAELAAAAGTTQSVVSRLENPDSANVNVSSLLKVADAFDVALSIEFCGFRKYIRYLQRVRSDVTEVRKFSEEIESGSYQDMEIGKSDIFDNNIPNTAERGVGTFSLSLGQDRQKTLVRHDQGRPHGQCGFVFGRERSKSVRNVQNIRQGNV